MPSNMALSTKAIFLSSKHHLFPNGISGFISAADLFWIQSCHGHDVLLIWTCCCVLWRVLSHKLRKFSLVIARTESKVGDTHRTEVTSQYSYQTTAKLLHAHQLTFPQNTLHLYYFSQMRLVIWWLPKQMSCTLVGKCCQSSEISSSHTNGAWRDRDSFPVSWLCPPIVLPIHLVLLPSLIYSVCFDGCLLAFFKWKW